MFRVCNDIVFCFDGDRAGRQAAWRALETCLPHAREGRQLKFLFLPDGHDPDTLVAEEGKDAFEARFDAAVPLSEYLVGHLRRRSRHHPGLAPPRSSWDRAARIPDGVYRELLVDRLAREVRMPAVRLGQLLGLWPGAAHAAPPKVATTRRATAPVRGAGRGSLVSQAIARIVQQPPAARDIRDPEILRRSGDRALDVLAELIEMANSEPHLTSAQLLERWRDRPEHSRLGELAALPLPELDDDAVARELEGAVARLVAEAGPERRLDALIARAESADLSDTEKQELRELQAHLRPPPGKPD
jgi:DNA primase